jgi:hypothetical protein
MGAIPRAKNKAVNYFSQLESGRQRPLFFACDN